MTKTMTRKKSQRGEEPGKLLYYETQETIRKSKKIPLTASYVFKNGDE